MCLTLCTPCIIPASNYIFNVLLLQYQECCVGICRTVYFGIPEDGVLAMKHTGNLHAAYDFLVVLCAFVSYCNYLQENACQATHKQVQEQAFVVKMSR